MPVDREGMARPARSHWRAWYYRRHWTAVMTIGKLAVPFQRRVLLPVPGRFVKISEPPTDIVPGPQFRLARLAGLEPATGFLEDAAQVSETVDHLRR